MRGHPTLVSPSSAATDAETARGLWALSERLTGVTYEFAEQRRGGVGPEPHGVVRAPVLGVDLRRVGEHEPRDAGLQRRDPLAVADRHDRLRRGLAVQPALAHPERSKPGLMRAQPGLVARQQRVGVEREQLVARARGSSRRTGSAGRRSARGSIRFVCSITPTNGSSRVGDVGPVERAEAAVELEQQAERGVVLDAAQPVEVAVRHEAGLEHRGEDVVGHGRHDGVVALGLAGGLEGARVVAGRNEPGAPATIAKPRATSALDRAGRSARARRRPRSARAARANSGSHERRG